MPIENENEPNDDDKWMIDLELEEDDAKASDPTAWLHRFSQAQTALP